MKKFILGSFLLLLCSCQSKFTKLTSEMYNLVKEYTDALDNAKSQEKIKFLKEEFERTMWHIYHIIGDNAFRIPTEYERRRPISMTLFEALYYLFQPFVQIKEEDITKLQESVKELLKDPVFLESLQFSVDSKNHVDIRFHKVMEKYQEKFNDK